VAAGWYCGAERWIGAWLGAPTFRSERRRAPGIRDVVRLVPLRPAMDPSRLRYDEQGLIPAIVQQHDTGEVLMLAWMSAQTVRESVALGETVFWSRSRGERWHKGATSGNTQKIVSMTADCDADTLLVRVDQQGSGACHTGAPTCFHHDLEPDDG
jgi:phosphoribosyl-AMP cyclohydrolase